MSNDFRGAKEAQLPQRNSASAAHVIPIGWQTDTAMHRTPQNRSLYVSDEARRSWGAF